MDMSPYICRTLSRLAILWRRPRPYLMIRIRERCPWGQQSWSRRRGHRLVAHLRLWWVNTEMSLDKMVHTRWVDEVKHTGFICFSSKGSINMREVFAILKHFLGLGHGEDRLAGHYSSWWLTFVHYWFRFLNLLFSCQWQKPYPGEQTRETGNNLFFLKSKFQSGKCH